MAATMVHVDLGPRSYDISVTGQALSGFADFARQRLRGSGAVVIGDEHVSVHAEAVTTSLTGAGWRCHTVLLKPGEQRKSLASASGLYDELVQFGADRHTAIVAVGGGVIGDLAGFVAATFNRGLPLLMVPTSLLAMVDSAVGGKVAVNHPQGKNLIGVFHQPAGVWIDLGALSTLPEREYRSGLAEVVKYGVILDAAFFEWLEKNAEAILRRDGDAVHHLVAHCCKLKALVVQQDEREETGQRAALNYGHTFAHAFEAAAGYGGWLHGEAVSAGMNCAARLAQRLGRIGPELAARQASLLKRLGLPTAPEPWPAAQLLQAMRTDKKALAGRLRFVLPVRLGAVELVENVAESEVLAVLAPGPLGVS
jgi:3-dehydroquinate synthase